MQNKPSCASLSSEQEQLTVWNNTHQAYPMSPRVHQLVSRKAETAPEALALTDCSVAISYKELEQRSNRLARYLQQQGVGPDVLVGLCVERSALMAIGALAVLKAGGAYLPIDPSYPPDRIAFMLEDAQPRAVITQASLVQRLSAVGSEVVVLDRESAETAQQSPDVLEDAGTLDNLAYVIYTSGSTGQPKGVQITHHGLLNLTLWHHQAFAITSADRATQLASPGFDAAVWELWPYLTAGASIFSPNEAIRNQPESLQEWLLLQQITICFVATPLAESLLALNWPANAALRVLLTGADTLRRYPRAGMPFVLVNNYGPTECTVVATSGVVSSDQNQDGMPSIGHPIANTQVHILDEKMLELPVGTAGELYIGGAGLARGYLNQPDLTAEKFVPNPFSNDTGSRLYRTGDRALYLPDGQISFLGRIDDQVKIRGFRIEINEVVNLLSKHPAVKSCVVAAREDIGHPKRLVAYVVPASDAQLKSSDLRSFLGKSLPEFMLPAVFVLLKSLPLTESGKVNRFLLPAPDDSNVVRDQQFVAPRNATEERVALILAPLLGLAEIGVEDNFFFLGGNSLLGTQVIARLRGTFGVEVSLLTLFDHPTVAGIAAELEQLIIARLDAMSDDEVRRLVAQSSEEAQI
jgi:amino acid adenylation domain-containing protein